MKIEFDGKQLLGRSAIALGWTFLGMILGGFLVARAITRENDAASQTLLTQAISQRDACYRNFQTATILWEPTESINLPGTVGAVVGVAPGTLVPLQPKWVIPAKVTPRLMHATSQSLKWQWIDTRSKQVVRDSIAQVGGPGDKFTMGQLVGDSQQ